MSSGSGRNASESWVKKATGLSPGSMAPLSSAVTAAASAYGVGSSLLFLMCRRRENVSVWFLKMSPTKRRKRNAREHVERRTDDLFLFLYETVFWLLSRGVVIAPPPRRRRRRARAFPSSMGDVSSWSFACLNRFLSFFVSQKASSFLLFFFVSTSSEKMTDLFLFLFLCVLYSLSLSSFETGWRRDGQFSFSNESLDKSRAQLFRGRFT